MPEYSDVMNDSAHVIGVRQHFGNETRVGDPVPYDIQSRKPVDKISARSHSVGRNSRYETTVRSDIVLVVHSLQSMSDVKEVKSEAACLARQRVASTPFVLAQFLQLKYSISECTSSQTKPSPYACSSSAQIRSWLALSSLFRDDHLALSEPLSAVIVEASCHLLVSKVLAIDIAQSPLSPQYIPVAYAHLQRVSHF
jgi:hypothetical protein